MKFYTRLFYVLILVTLWLGCAHVATVATACKPSADQEVAILDAATKPTQAEALAAIDGLGFVLCVLQQGVDDAIKALDPGTGARAAALVVASSPDTLANLKAWRAAHP